MKRRTKAAVGLAAALAIGALAGAALAGGEEAPGPLRLSPDRVRQHLPVERAKRVERAKSGQELNYFHTVDPLTIEPQTEEGATLQCPKGYHAIGGYFVTGKPGTFLDQSAPEVSVPPSSSDPATKPSKRNWLIDVFNSTQETDQVRLGVVCLNKVK